MSVFDRYPRITLTAASVLLLLIALGIGEIVAKWLVKYDIGYYIAFTEKGRHVYRYGAIEINSMGFPDVEWNLQDARPRIGYVGDSVVWGVGAGSGHRFVDILKTEYPGIQHMIFAGPGNGIQSSEIDRIVELVERFRLARVVYVMNLNDVLPALEDTSRRTSGESVVMGLKEFVAESFDGLRGKSYLYNYVRTKAKEVLTLYGFEAHGLKAYELFPGKHTRVFAETMQRVNALADRLEKMGSKLCVLLLPYEMQISAEAEATYRRLGVEWEDGFVERSAQKQILRYLKPGIEHLDLYFAFVSETDAAASRHLNKVGQYFVYNKGDKMDWNHPNREGHRKIAQFITARKGAVCLAP